MKVAKTDEDLDLGMNMTPMIDIVFQLIIFFMVVTELATLDLERVVLPYAKLTDTEKDRIDQSTMITININKKGDIIYKRQKHTDEMLRDLLKWEAENAGTEPNPFAPDKRLSNLQVLIRADRDTKYEGIQRVMDACQRNGVWKTSVASTEEVQTMAE